MEDNFEKPLYEDYKVQKASLRYRKDDIISMGRSCKLADKPLVISGWMLLLFTCVVIGVYNPLSIFTFLHFAIMIIMFCLFIPAFLLYERYIVYRFARFRVKWENEERHPNEQASNHCDRNGKLLKTRENRKAARKSRLAFLGLYICLIAAILLYCFLGLGLAYTRVYNWNRAEIEEAAQIAYKYDSVYVQADGTAIYVEGETANGENVSAEDEQRLDKIYASLQWDYVYVISLNPDKSDDHRRLSVEIGSRYWHSELLRYEKIVDISQVIKDYPDNTVTQLDEHWWYVR